MNDTLKSIFNRTSVRRFTSKEVDRETLLLLAKCGMAAPSANNKQPWFIIIVTEKQLLKALGDQLPYAKMAHEAAAAMVVCGNLEIDPVGNEKGYWVQDCSAATENILIAAVSLGLGTVWTAAFPNADRISTVKNILNLPDHLVPLNVIPLGYPEGTTRPKEKWNEGGFRFNAFPSSLD